MQWNTHTESTQVRRIIRWVNSTCRKNAELIIDQSFSFWMMRMIGFFLGGALADHPVLRSPRALRNEVSVWLEYIVLSRTLQAKQRDLAALGRGSERLTMMFSLVAWKYPCFLPCRHYWDLALLANRNLIFQDSPLGLSDISFAFWLFQLVIPHFWYL